MAKAASIDMNDVFTPPPQTQVITPPATYGDYLPSLANPAGPGPGSAASQRLSGQVRGLSAGKERIGSASSYSSKRTSGTPLSSGPLPSSPPLGSDAFPPGGPANGRLPPLMHGYVANTPSRNGSPGTAPFHHHSDGKLQTQTQSQLQYDSKQLQQLFPERQFPERQAQSPHTDGGKPHGEVIQPLIQHPSMLPGPIPTAHPYQPKRKPPSAFMRKNPMIQQLEQSTAGIGTVRSTSAGSSQAHGPYDGQSYGALLPNDVQAQHFADEVMAAAEAAMANGGWATGEDAMAGSHGGGGGGVYMSAPPWGVSSVSDLEALDSILDQLVVVDARMRRALLQGPLISFETVVPEHIMQAAAAAAMGRQLRPMEDEKDRTFLTGVKDVGEEAGGDDGDADVVVIEGGDSAVEPDLSPPPPSPSMMEASTLGGAFTTAGGQNTAHQALRSGAAPDDYPADSSLFPAAIPNPGMHPSFTRAYLASKLATKPQHLPPPPAPTAEHLLRSRPPPFIAAPSYDQLCSQIRDVQRQYTCGSSRPAGQGPVVAAAGGLTAAGALALAATASPTHQYIAGLDGPTLDEVVGHQELPINLERVRPTFVALKQKARRSASPRRSPLRGQVAAKYERQGSGGPIVQGRAS